MKSIQTIEDVYPAIEELIVELKVLNHLRMADILHHRLHDVAWTARSELFEELQSVLTEASWTEGANLPEGILAQIQAILRVVEGYLRNETGNGGTSPLSSNDKTEK